jgi:hypothetical protein
MRRQIHTPHTSSSRGIRGQKKQLAKWRSQVQSERAFANLGVQTRSSLHGYEQACEVNQSINQAST